MVNRNQTLPSVGGGAGKPDYSSSIDVNSKTFCDGCFMENPTF